MVEKVLLNDPRIKDYIDLSCFIYSAAEPSNYSRDLKLICVVSFRNSHHIASTILPEIKTYSPLILYPCFYVSVCVHLKIFRLL